jgi:hypothetical protein
MKFIRPLLMGLTGLRNFREFNIQFRPTWYIDLFSALTENYERKLPVTSLHTLRRSQCHRLCGVE